MTWKCKAGTAGGIIMDCDYPNCDCEPAPQVNLDAFEEDFDGALDSLVVDVIARVDHDTSGMSELQVKQYWVDKARRHLAEVERLSAPECIIERARSVLARREAALRKP